MKLKSLLLSLLVMFAAIATAQVEDGKVYRIVSAKYGTVVSENPITHKLSCTSKGTETDYQEMWKFAATADGKFTIQNVYTQRYIQYETGKNVVWRTATDQILFSIAETPNLKGCYNIDRAVGNNWGMHCDGSSNIVPWSYGTSEISGTEWNFELVNISAEEIAAATIAYQDYSQILDNKEAIAAEVSNIFADKAGTTLKAEYAAKSDAELLAAIPNAPEELKQVVLKIKNNTWATCERPNLSEKAFRIYDYKPYSNPEKWKDILYHRVFNRINNPTGICATSSKSFIYVFVDEIPEGTEVYLAEMKGTAYFGTDTELVAGLNIVPAANKDGVLYIRYICDTHTGFDVATKSGPKKLSDYPTLKVHIEGGYVNGFWSKERGHTNEDWVYMGQNMFRNEEAVQAVGDESMLNFRKKEFLQPYQYTDNWGFKVEGCPTDIETVMKFWDFWNERQRWYMNLDDYYDYFNNKQLAMSDDNGFMDASNYRTHYNNNTLTTIVNIDRISRDGGSAWGPLHEIGHTNQYAFEIVGTSEVSNNALANFTIFDTGTHTSRGWNMDAQIADFQNNIPYVVRGEGVYGSELFSMTRMYFQLFLYFHAAGKHPEFYPTLFEELRKDKLVGWTTSSNRDLIEDENGFILGSMDATHDQLKFVEKCCSIAQMDLTEFFEAWGFFIPMKNAFVGDYGHHHVYLLQDSIDACKARIKAANYPKKGGHLMFLEDRIRPSMQKKSILNENPSGYRADYSDEAPVANNFCGLFGQWEDYIDESVKAEGYFYAVSKNKVVIKEADNAKGALGFKLYNADTDKLLSYTNRLEMTIPQNAMGANLKVVAAQADGTDYVVPHASQGPESMQRDALDGSLKSANTLIKKATDDDKKVGYYYKKYFTELNSLYDRANAALKNNDTSEHSYAEWSIMLDDACNEILNNPDTRIPLREGAVFTMVNNYDRDYYAAGTYPVCDCVKKSSSTEADIKWTIEYAGKSGEYYLKNTNGYYITSLAKDNSAYVGKTVTEETQKFTIKYTLDGFTTIHMNNDESIVVGLGSVNGARKVLGKTPSETNGQWKVDIVEDNSAEFYKQALEEMLLEAEIRITEIINLDSIGTMNMFKPGIRVLDRNLETYATDLLNDYYIITKDIENAENHMKYVNILRKHFDNIDGKYAVTAPIATDNDRVVWYYVINNDNDNLMSIYSGNKAAQKNRVVPSDEVNDYALWGFASTGKNNEYNVYNKANKGFIYGKTISSIYTSAEEDCLPITVTYVDGNSVTLGAGEQYLYDTGTYVNLGTDKEFWRLEVAGIDYDQEVADIITTIEQVMTEANADEAIYDLNGRRVVNPVRGIFIQGGKKVLVK